MLSLDAYSRLRRWRRRRFARLWVAFLSWALEASTDRQTAALAAYDLAREVERERRELERIRVASARLRRAARGLEVADEVEAVLKRVRAEAEGRAPLAVALSGWA